MTNLTTTTYLLDYGAGNIRSVVNAAKKLGYSLNFISTKDDFNRAERIIFPGVGSFGNAVEALSAKGFLEPLRDYILSGKPFMGICIGMQVLFEGSEESPGVDGLRIIPGRVKKFSTRDKVVPHMGWNEPFMLKEPTASPTTEKKHGVPKNSFDRIYSVGGDRAYYYVHSYAVPYSDELKDWTLCTTQYGSEVFVAAVSRGNVLCTQFHPEKSGVVGLEVLRSFLAADFNADSPSFSSSPSSSSSSSAVDHLASRVLPKDRFKKRIIAALDVRTNDEGDLVVTKGDRYDVREKDDEDTDEQRSISKKSGGPPLKGEVRNLGKPVDLARRYYEEGVDEICFLNITSFRSCPLEDLPMLEVLRRASETIFVPLTIGGGIKDFESPDGTTRRAIDVVGEYFRSGADKVSLGSEAVYATERYLAASAASASASALVTADGEPRHGSTPPPPPSPGFRPDGTSVIEQIAHAYGTQAVVISVDPRRVYVPSPSHAPTHTVIPTSHPGPNDERYCWFQCTVSGGRHPRDIDVHQLVTTCALLGAGEILLNSMDRDGTNLGYDLELINEVRGIVNVPVIASSGAGRKEDFKDVFEETHVDAALAAGIFHRREAPIGVVKTYLKGCGVPIRPIR